ncbi:hypothetical protein [Roseateles sp. P5_E4]
MNDVEPLRDIEEVTWTNLRADSYSGSHRDPVALFLNDVINPSLDAIEARIGHAQREEGLAADFELIDLEPLHSSTLQGYTLTVQSVWERQLRGYLIACAKEQGWDGEKIDKLQRKDWDWLCKRFKDLKGVALEAFPSFSDLDLLMLLGHACRHGDGAAARKLFDRCPGLWVNWPPALPDGWPGEPLKNVPSYPPFKDVTLTRDLLTQMVIGVIWFWEDWELIYTNSLKRKHWSVHETVKQMRRRRAERVRVWSPV